MWIPFPPSSRLRRQLGATLQKPYGVHLGGALAMRLR